MKATELKQGDWVRCLMDKKLHQVTGIRENVVFSNGWSFQEDHVEPIELTPDILTRNADISVNTDPEWLFIIDDDREISIFEIEESGSFVAWVKSEYASEPLRSINYVHELQHLLWAMGINDNFEIL